MTWKQKLYSAFVTWILHPLGLDTKEETEHLQRIYAALETYHYFRGHENEEKAWKEVESAMNKYMAYQHVKGPFYVNWTHFLK